MATIHDTDDEMAKYVASRTDEQNHLDELDRQVESLRFSANYYEKLWEGLKKKSDRQSRIIFIGFIIIIILLQTRFF